MATYKESVGTAVQNIAGDTGTVTGQLWYDSSDSEFKYKYQAYGNAWSTGSNLNTARNGVMGSTSGTQTATLAFGGFIPPYTGATESYNGTNWTEVADLTTTRYSGGGAGTQTSSLAFGGYASPGETVNTESWNGSSWTEVANLNSARGGLAGVGATNTAALAFGGESPGTAAEVITESWNGTSWTEVGDLNTGRDQLAGSGTNTAALASTGNSDPASTVLADTENWNGTTWTDVADVNTARKALAGSGSSTAALIFGGRLAPGTVQSITESWNGSIWTETADLNIVQSIQAGSGTNSSALSFGGYDGSSPGNVATTQEFNAGINLGAWYTGGNMNTARRGLAQNSAGTQTAGMCIGGFVPPRLADTELYNGTSWSEVNNLNLARYGGGGVGVQTSALYFGGSSANPSPENPGFTRENKNESWNGYTWTEVNDLNSGRSDLAGVGASNTEALCFGGKNPVVNPPGGLLALTESWNGTSWTEVGDMNTQKEQPSGIGTTTAALAVGGASLTAVLAETELYNGTAWTEVNDLNTTVQGAGGAGTSTAALAFGGSIPSNTAITQEWNGTNWSNVNSMNTARTALGGLGSSTAALAFGGYIGPSNTNETEEWDGTGFITRTITTTTE